MPLNTQHDHPANLDFLRPGAPQALDRASHNLLSASAPDAHAARRSHQWTPELVTS